MLVYGRSLGSGFAAKIASDAPSLEDFLPLLNSRSIYRAPGTAVFLAADPDQTPVALMHNLKHNKTLHQNNFIVCVRTADAPRVDEDARAAVDQISTDFTKITLTYGFMESPNVPLALAALRSRGINFDIMATSFFLGRKTIVRGTRSNLPKWVVDLYIWMTRNAANPTNVFRIPPGRVVEMGGQITI